MVTSSLLDRDVGSLRATVVRAHCVRAKQHYTSQKKTQKLHVILQQGRNNGSLRRAEQLVCWFFPLELIFVNYFIHSTC